MSCRTLFHMCGSWYFPTFLFEGWVIDSDVHGLPDGSGGAMCLCTYDGETVYTGSMSHGLVMLVDGGGGF